jgi:peptidoglycan/LPS O-acetylase OafA/YrhL
MQAAADTGREVVNSGRIHELDALRGLAALGVVFWHYRVDFHARPLDFLLHPFYNAGFLLVDFFFVLSGFVIARAYWRPSRQRHLAGNIWARLARLYPLHLLTLLVTLALLASLPSSATDPDFRLPSNNLKHLLLHLLLLNQVGLQDGGWSFNVPAWSISTEFVTNVAFLAFIAMGVRMRWACAIAVAAGGALLFAVMRPPLIEGQTAFGFWDVYLLRCMLGFGAGVVVYLARQWPGFDRRTAAAPALATAIGFLSIVGLVGLMIASGRHPRIGDYLVSIAFSIGCVAFVPGSRVLKSLLGWHPLVRLGEISYSVYLVHYPLQLALYALSERSAMRLDYASPVVLLAYTSGVIAVALFTYRRVELPAQARLLAWAKRRRLQQPA